MTMTKLKSVQIERLDGTNLEEWTENVDNLKANLESPAFTGSPTTPTVEFGSVSEQIANTEFVQRAIDDALDEALVNSIIFS